MQSQHLENPLLMFQQTLSDILLLVVHLSLLIPVK